MVPFFAPQGREHSTTKKNPLPRLNDGIGNISVQGPVVTLTMTRETQGSKSENSKNQEIIHLTMTGQNLLKITNILNNTINRIAQRSKKVNEENNKSLETDPVTQEKKKDKTVN